MRSARWNKTQAARSEQQQPECLGGVGDVCNWRLQKFPPTCRRVDGPLCALGEEGEEWSCGSSLSEIAASPLFLVIYLFFWFTYLKIVTETHKLINWLEVVVGFFLRLRRNSCADSSRGQYARMGPLQYFFLCGLLYTQTDGKLMNTFFKKCVKEALPRVRLFFFFLIWSDCLRRSRSTVLSVASAVRREMEYPTW